MPRNYDTRESKPYVRVERIEIYYPASGVPLIEYVEREAFVAQDGAVRFLDSQAVRHTLQLNPPEFTDRIPLVDTRTGEQIEGSTSLRELLVGITATIRNDQIRRDTTPTPAPEMLGLSPEPERPAE